MGRFLVLGAGKMGIVLAKDLIESDSKNKVTLVDIDSKQLEKASEFINSERLIPFQRNIEDKKQRDEIFNGKDVSLSALLHKHSLLALEASVRAGAHFVDLAGEGPQERLKYNELAKRKKVTLISGLGVSPGITNVCVGRAVHLLDEAVKAYIYVGGNPVYPRPPLNYRVVYALDSLLNLYEREVPIIKKGNVKIVPPLSSLESIEFDPPFSEMECFYTDGLNSLLHTMKGKIKDELWEKTIRHKGHIQEMQTLRDCGLFSRQLIRINDQEITPRDILEVLLDDKMKLGKEKDVTLMRIIVKGKKSGRPQAHLFEMIDRYDSNKGYTSMAKTTSFPASIAAQMIVSDTIRQRGCLFPENIFHAKLYKPFMEALKTRGVIVNHRTHSDS